MIKLLIALASFLFLLSSIVFVETAKGGIKTSSTSSSSINDDDICTAKTTCAQCIRTRSCVWCSEKRNLSDPALNTIPRCMSRSAINTKGGNWCQSWKIVDMVSELKITKDVEFSVEEGNQVQVKPQRVTMRLRQGEEMKLTVKYKQASDYPVDLYFLMDLSFSMEDHRNNLSNLGQKLASALTSITKNFRLGFGSFIDKVALPMTNTQEEWSQGSCSLKDGSHCDRPYEFKNQMPLTASLETFKAQVMKAPISANIDSPEGGLDALMQAIVCRREIGWRDSARHLLVFSTDAKYHIAGDGRLAGIVEPNDEQCHLNKTGFYTHAEILDYPSLAQIKTVAKESGIYIIFAVTDNVYKDYKQLSEYLPTSSIGILDRNSQNVVGLVTAEYSKLINGVKMTHNTLKKIDVKVHTNCANPNQPLQEKSECGNVRVDKIFEFEYLIKAVDCSNDPKDWRKTIIIKPEGVNETVTVDIELLCDCPCSRPEHNEYIQNAAECETNGDLTCGVCSCKKGFYGKQCLCTDDKSRKNTENSLESCRASNTSTEQCSGRGKCICGECVCEPRENPNEHYHGTYCECDNFSCDQSFDKVCGGPERGTCDCGVCKCNAGLEGKACDCESSIANCLPPGENTKECNGFGKCKCGKCVCDPATERDGQFCEKCSTCPSQLCDELKDCVECMAYQAGNEFEKDKSCGECKRQIDLTMVENLNETIADESNHVCTMPDAAGCTFMFQYSNPSRGDSTGNSRTVIAEREKKCSLPPVSAIGVAGAAIGLTLFLGLLGLLAWKVLTMLHDHREYIKFEKERVRATYQGGTNPIFKAPTSTFTNPTFENQQSTKS